MIKNPVRKCHCKRYATHTSNDLFFCENHKTSQCVSINDVCSFCLKYIGNIPNLDTTLCYNCQYDIDNGTNTIKHREKELAIKNLFSQHIHFIQFINNKQITNDRVTKYRPDFLCKPDWGSLVIEIDENQHKYGYSDDEKRMKLIHGALDTEKTIFIRYNPDKYKSQTQHSKQPREKFLLKYVLQLYNSISNDIPLGLSVIYLYYDNFTPDDIPLISL